MPIQLVAQVAGGAPSAFTTPPIDTRQANFIVIVAGASNNFDPAPTNSKGDGASYTGLTSVHYGTGGYQTCKIWYQLNPLVDVAHTFTLVQAAQNPCLAVMAFSGVGVSPLDVEGTPYTANNNTWPLPTITPGQANELIIVSAVGQVAANSIDSGFTLLSGGSTGSWQPAIACLIETTLQAKAPTITPASYNSVAAKMVTFKAAGSSFNSAWARGANQLIGGQ